MDDHAGAVDDAAKPGLQDSPERDLDAFRELTRISPGADGASRLLERQPAGLEGERPSVAGGERRDAFVREQPVDRRKVAKRAVHVEMVEPSVPA